MRNLVIVVLVGIAICNTVSANFEEACGADYEMAKSTMELIMGDPKDCADKFMEGMPGCVKEYYDEYDLENFEWWNGGSWFGLAEKMYEVMSDDQQRKDVQECYKDMHHHSKKFWHDQRDKWNQFADLMKDNNLSEDCCNYAKEMGQKMWEKLKQSAKPENCIDEGGKYYEDWWNFIQENFGSKE